MRMLLLALLIFPVVSANAQNAKILSLVSQVSQTNLEMHVDSLAYAGGHLSRITFTEGNYVGADYIARYFESLPGISFVQRDTFNLAVAESPYNKYPLINIIAQLDGTSENPKTFIIGGHYDASCSRESNYTNLWSTRKAQGADDNATGVAAILEIARILSDPNNNFKTRANIRFVAFAAEEYHPKHDGYHHLGSLFDAQKMDKLGINITGVVVLDMIAFNPNYEYIEIISNQASTWLADSLYTHVSEYVSGLQTNKPPYPDVPYSDHDSYQQYGYPAVLLMENHAPWNNNLPYYTANPNYHTSNDKVTTLNNLQMKLVTQLALATTAELNMDQTVPVLRVTPKADIELPFTVFPNPFNNVINIRFSITKTENIQIRIFNVQGREIINMKPDVFTSGTYEVSWHGKNKFGHDVASGLYLITLESKGKIYTRKVFYLR